MKKMDLKVFLENTSEHWMPTRKKHYRIQGMMVSKDTSFHNDLEDVDYTVTDDGITVVLKGTVGEMWTSKLHKVVSTYTKPDGSTLTESDFADKDKFVDICTISESDTTNYAMKVPSDVSVTVETAWGDVLHTNRPNAPHGKGDYLVCGMKDGKPNVNDVWVVNGAVFPNTYW